MFPFANTLAAGDQDVIYIGGVLYPNTATSAALSTLGAVAGDFAFYVTLNGTTISSGSGKEWTSLGSDGAFYAFYRTLDAADVAAGIFSPSGAVLLIYRGPIVSCALATRAGQGGYPVQNGFGRHRAHVGLIAAAYSNSGEQPPTVVTPNFAVRGIASEPGRTRVSGFDRLSPPNPTYVNFAPFTVDVGAASIYELRSE